MMFTKKLDHNQVTKVHVNAACDSGGGQTEADQSDECYIDFSWFANGKI